MAHWRAVLLIGCIAMPAAAAAQQIATRPRADDSSAYGEARAAPPRPVAPRPVALSAPSGDSPSAKAGAANRSSSRSSGPSLTTMLASLAMVLGLFMLAAWALRKGLRLPSQGRTLPTDVVEVLGRISLAPRQPAELVRVGHKLILVSLSAAGVRTLTEITDPAEVDRLAGLCRQAHPQSSTAVFRQVFQQFGRQPASGFLDREPSLSLAGEGPDVEESDA